MAFVEYLGIRGMKWGNPSDICKIQERLLWNQEEGTVITFSMSLVSLWIE
jgi:hypothetical protein